MSFGILTLEGPHSIYRFTLKSGIRWEAYIVPKNGDRFLGGRTITFTKHQPIDWESGGRKEEETAVEWPDPRVGRLVMVEKYTDTDDTDDTRLIIFCSCGHGYVSHSL